jgi:hypothetical protein
MHPRLRSVSVSLVLAAGAALALVAPGSPAGADAGGTETDNSANPVTLAVIGDVPYGAAQEATVGDLVGAVNADPKARRVIHVGDIKSGSTTCTDERFAAVKGAFDSFEDPLVYTPGDNEWTDCHRANNGTYDPLERLAAVRRLFFAEPGATLGRHPGHVAFQSGLVENVRWIGSRTAFATLHTIGSDNGLAPWTGLGFTAPTPAQAAEVADRNARTVAWIDGTFDEATARGLVGVALFMQADTFGPGPSPAQQAVVDRIATRAAAFPGKVLLVQGDSHTYKVDTPLTNVTRIVVHGETLPFEYLRLTVDPRNPVVFSWERSPVAPAA